jgi:hypothetical protein
MVLTGLLVLAAGAYGQNPPPGGGRMGRSGRGPADPAFQGAAPGGVRFLGAEAGMPGRVVKNAPYSADSVTESTQTLPDGNHIRQTTTSRVYRDTEGRTRREQSLGALGGLAPNTNLPQVVFISDPVAGVNYALNAKDRTATKSTSAVGGRGGQWGSPDQQKGRARESAAQQKSPDLGRGNRRGGGPSGPADQNLKTEPLGRQMIEGVQADGTRTTLTIPAGQMGNEQPIQIVTERWYSPELQTVVLSRHTDPRLGETVFKLGNISRTEPARYLFEAPADYKVTEAGGRGGRPGGVPPPRQ